MDVQHPKLLHLGSDFDLPEVEAPGMTSLLWLLALINIVNDDQVG